MKISLIQGWLGPDPPDSLVFPLGLSYIGTALEAVGHDVAIVDPNAQPDGLGAVAAELKARAPEVVGVSLRNIDTTDYIAYRYYYQHLAELLDVVEVNAPQALLLIGGTGFSTFPERIMADHPRIDFGIYLEGEQTVVELLAQLDAPASVAGLYLRDGEIVRFSGPRAFAGYPDFAWPRRDLVDVAPYLAVERAIGVQSYRGCPLSCIYCNYPKLNGRRVRIRTARDVVDEISELHDKYGITEVIFADSLFDLRRGFAREICDELIARAVPVRWSAWFETYRFDEEWFTHARRAGCYRFCFSPDGATDATMTAMGKRCREEDVARVLALAAKYPDVAFRFTLFCNNPGQDWHDVIVSVRFVWRSHFTLANSRCLLSWTRIFPNSDLYATIVADGSFDRRIDLLPPEVSDHRTLFHRAPDSPRSATRVMRATWRFAEAARQARKRAPRIDAVIRRRVAGRVREIPRVPRRITVTSQ